ncbi:MAG: hypothetical protein L0Z62_02860 [Gemmataceae bacterium]|nr:hypothetical protein [Gemmataceae bacterium]
MTQPLQARQERSAPRPRRCPVWVLALVALFVGPPPEHPAVGGDNTPSRRDQEPARLLTSEQAWKRLPRAEKGTGQPLPV